MNPEVIHSFPHDILVTKLYIPSLRKGLVRRPRLVGRLIGGSEKKLILITAPAGYGKTTLLTEWLSQTDTIVAWYSLDDSDNDLGRFLTYFVLALQGVNAGICEIVLSFIRSPDPPPLDTILTSLINDLACLDTRCALILDDFHLIHDHQIHYALSFILQYIPPNLQIVAASRNELPFSISNLRAKDQVVVLDTFDMRFTESETAAFIHQIFGIELDAELLNELEQRTEGWVTGLQLAAMGMKDHSDFVDFIQHLSGDDRLIADYLLDEVLSNQPEHVQNFITRTSILPRFSSSLCDAVLQIENSQEILAYLEQTNLFIISLDNRRTWYRYHHLFSELLRNRLEQLSQDLISNYYRRAAVWSEQHNYFDEALDYALAAEDFEYAAQLLEPRIAKIITEGGRDQGIRWMQSIPMRTLRRTGYLWQYLIMAWLEKGNFLEAEKILNHVWEDLDRLEDISQEDKDIILGYKNGYRGSISIHSQMEAGQTRQFTKLAGDLLPDQEIMGRSVAYGHYGSACLHLGNLDEADAALSQALTLSKSLDYSLLHLLWLSYQAQVVAARGRLAQAKGLFEDAFQFAESLGVQKSNVFSNSVIGLGSLYYEWNDLEAAEKTLNEGVSIAEAGDYLDRLMVGYLSFVQLRLTMGDYQTLEEKIAYVRNIAKKYRYPYRVMQGIEAMQTRIDMTNGDLQKASAWAESIKPPPNFDEMDILQEYQLSTLASVWMAAGKYALAVNLLQSLLGMARKQKRWRDVIRLGNMLAVAHKQNGEMSIALDTLKDSLQRGREEGYVRSFLDLGTEMQALLTILSTKSQGLSKELLTYIEKLLESFRLEKKDVITEQGAGPRLLTAREMEVMRALSKGLTYAIIARNLVISENTLKSHIKNIYSKLEVNNRTQAILQAEKKGLLS